MTSRGAVPGVRSLLCRHLQERFTGAYALGPRIRTTAFPRSGPVGGLQPTSTVRRRAKRLLGYRQVTVACSDGHIDEWRAVPGGAREDLFRFADAGLANALLGLDHQREQPHVPQRRDRGHLLVRHGHTTAAVICSWSSNGWYQVANLCAASCAATPP
jgi:hypothetical protein